MSKDQGERVREAVALILCEGSKEVFENEWEKDLRVLEAAKRLSAEVLSLRSQLAKALADSLKLKAYQWSRDYWYGHYGFDEADFEDNWRELMNNYRDWDEELTPPDDLPPKPPDSPISRSGDGTASYDPT